MARTGDSASNGLPGASQPHLRKRKRNGPSLPQVQGLSASRTPLRPPVPTLDFRTPIPAPAEALFAWHAQPGAFERLVPPWTDVELRRFEGIRNGQEAELRLSLGPLYLTWLARHKDYVEGRQFKDEQIRGPFKSWEHTHRMEPASAEAGPEASVLHDHLEYEVPLGGIGRLATGAQIERQIERQFAYRHRITREDLAAHRRLNPEGRSLRIAVSGAGGLIGSALVSVLTTGGHEVVRMMRQKPADPRTEIYWNHHTGEIEADKLEGVDAVIHLAGENVFAPRWTEAKKMRIYASRARGTELIAKTLASLSDPPEVFVSASAVGVYGSRGNEILTEESAPGERGFLTAVCREWEAATRPAAEAGIRTVNARIGVVLTSAGGALQLMLPAFRLGLGGTAGDPNQWISWIALDDVLHGLYHALLTDGVEGPLNLTAPEPVTMRVLARTLAGVLGRPAFFHVPPFVLRLLMGEAADEFALASARVLPEKLQKSGYDFLYSDLEDALRHQLGLTFETETLPALS